MHDFIEKNISKSWGEIFLSFLVGFAFFISVPIFTLFFFANDIKSKSTIITKKDLGIVLYDRHDKPFFTFYQGKSKDYVSLDEIPDTLKKAVIAVEDRDFYKHKGYSIKSIIRSAIGNLKEGELAQGGSTLTQQLVKNTLLNPRKDFLRKYQEIILATELEERYTKDEILEMYLNAVYWGDGAAGISAAANTYFNKEPKELSLSEVSLLAGILPAPSRLSPVSGDPDKAKARQKLVLSKMVEQKYITEEGANTASQESLTFNQPTKDEMNRVAPHFALMVRDQLVEKYGEEFLATSGYKIKTTIDLNWQEQAEKTVKEQVERLRGNRVSNGSAVAIDPRSGEVLVLVGSKEWKNEEFGKVNIALSPRQPGSSFKPIIYTAALEKGLITPATILKDEKVTYDVLPDPYSPKNYDGKFRGPVLARNALAMSLNVPAVEVMNKVGVSVGLEMAERLGITTLGDDSRFGLSLVLGAGEVKLIEMAKAYGVFANKGIKNEPIFITEIKDKHDKVLYSANPKPEQVLAEEHAYLISSILADNQARAQVFGKQLSLSEDRPAAVKTGTTQNYKDAWTIGYTPQLVVAAWVGNNDGEEMDRVAGSMGAAPIWKSLMESFLFDQPILAFEKPSNIVALAVCKSSGLVASPEASGGAYTEYFIDGTQPTKPCPKPTPPPEDLAATDSNNPQPTPAAVVQVDFPVGGPSDEKQKEKKEN